MGSARDPPVLVLRDAASLPRTLPDYLIYLRFCCQSRYNGRRARGDGDAGAQVQTLHAGPADAAAAGHRRPGAGGLDAARRGHGGALHRQVDADGPLSRRRRARPRPADDAQGGAVRLRLRDLLQPRDRAGHPRERRVPVDMRHAAARPLHGQPLPHRAGAARLRGGVRRGHPAPRGHGPGDARHLLPGRHQDRGQRQQVHVRVGEVDQEVQGAAPGQGARQPRGHRRDGRRGGGAGPRRPVRDRLRGHRRGRAQDQRAHRPQGRGQAPEGRGGQGPEEGQPHARG